MTFGLELALLAAAGFASGAVNVAAGGGSFLTLPLLIFAGLPGPVANATNRVGVLAQNVSGLVGFLRHGALDRRWAVAASLPALLGAAAGASLALRAPDFAFARILSLAMLAVTLLSLWQSRRARRGEAGESGGPAPAPPQRAWLMAGFFVAGVYGGFIQAGVGFFMLALTSAAGLDLLRGNAVKLWGVLLMTVLSLLIFSNAGTVDWPRGAALGVGNTAGAIVGVKLAVMKGHAWLDRVVNATVLIFAVLLWTA